MRDEKLYSVLLFYISLITGKAEHFVLTIVGLYIFFCCQFSFHVLFSFGVYLGFSFCSEKVYSRLFVAKTSIL